MLRWIWDTRGVDTPARVPTEVQAQIHRTPQQIHRSPERRLTGAVEHRARPYAVCSGHGFDYLLCGRAGWLRLLSRHPGQWLVFYQLPHPLSKRIATEPHLPAQRVPGRLRRGARRYEAPVDCPGPLLVTSELTEKPIDRQPDRCRCLTHRRSVAVPRPITRLSHHPGAHGVQHDVAAELQQVAVRVHHNAFVPPLEEAADAAVAAVDTLV